MKRKKNSLTHCRLTLCGVWLGAVSHCVESRFLQISLQKQFFQWNYFRLFIRDPNGFNSWRRKNVHKILWHCLFNVSIPLFENCNRKSKYSKGRKITDQNLSLCKLLCYLYWLMQQFPSYKQFPFYLNSRTWKSGFFQ